MDTEKAEEVAAAYGIYNLPTLIIFRGGQPLARREGYLEEIDLRLWINKVLPPAQ